MPFGKRSLTRTVFFDRYAATPPEITEITVNEASRNMDLSPVRKNTKKPASTMTILTTMPTLSACCSIFF